MPSHNRYWEASIPDHDLQVFDKAGWGRPVGIGRRPAVMVIDVNRNFCGMPGEAIADSVVRWRASCGEAAWDAMPHIQDVLRAARDRGFPVIYTTGTAVTHDQAWRAGRWNDKNTRRTEEFDDAEAGQAIVDEIKPEPQDLVLTKEKPSAFFGTALAAHLRALDVDSLIVCGTTTSGCVRATVVDAFSYNYRVTVLADASFDRSDVVHNVNLFDMDQKYADVLTTEETLNALASIPA